MKKIVKTPTKVERVIEVVTEETSAVVESEGGLISLLGKKVFFHCLNYNYIGTLTGVNQSCVEISDGGVVFETGPYTGNMMKNFEKLPTKFFVSTALIESFFETK